KARLHAFGIQVSAAGRLRPGHERAVPATGRLRRRPVPGALAIYRYAEPRAGPALDAFGPPAADAARARLVAQLWPGVDPRKPAHLRGVDPGSAGCRPAVVVELVLARRASGPGRQHQRPERREAGSQPARRRRRSGPAARAAGSAAIAQ